MMEVTPQLVRKAQEAAKKFEGEPVQLEGLGGHYLATADYLVCENETRMVMLGIDGVKYLIFIRN